MVVRLLIMIDCVVNCDNYIALLLGFGGGLWLGRLWLGRCPVEGDVPRMRRTNGAQCRW